MAAPRGLAPHHTHIMNSRRILAGFGSVVLALIAPSAPAQTLVQNNNAIGFSTVLFTGQSFLTPNDGTADLMTGFTWLTNTNTPMGAGSLYLFDQEYLGTPAAIASGTGLLATSATYSAGSYSFGGGVVLDPNTQYWAYTSSAQQVGITIGNAYANGSYYSSSGSGVNFAMNVGGTDAAFAVTASPVPEPSTYAALTGLAALGLAAWRRRVSREA